MSDNITFYRAPSGDYFRVTIDPDESATSPREWTNVTTLVSWNDRYESPDQTGLSENLAPWVPSEYVGRSGVDSRRAAKWMALFEPDILAFVFLQRDPDGRLQFDTEASDRRHYEGIGVVTRQSWNECMGEDYSGDVKPADMFASEVEVYNAWATGEFAGYLVEKLTNHGWQIDESCAGFESFDIALEMAIDEELPDGSVEVDEAETDEAEWNDSGEVLSIPAETRNVYDENTGRWTVQVATCGHCGRSWNDAASTSITPTPGGRCPFESMHEYDDAAIDWNRSANLRRLIDEAVGLLSDGGAESEYGRGIVELICDSIELDRERVQTLIAERIAKL